MSPEAPPSLEGTYIQELPSFFTYFLPVNDLQSHGQWLKPVQFVQDISFCNYVSLKLRRGGELVNLDISLVLSPKQCTDNSTSLLPVALRMWKSL
jgi:hypothetical protein